MYIRPDSITGFFKQVSMNDTIGATQPFNAFNLNFRGITGSLVGTYQFNNQLSLKANIALGYRAPNITEISANGLDPGAHIYYLGSLYFKPEFSLQEDIGVLGAYRDFSFDLSIFNNYIENYIYEDLKTDANGNPVVIVPGNRTFEYKQTNAQLYGLNATFNVHPGSWKAFGFNNSISIVYGNNLSPNFKNKGVEGQYLPSIPPPRLLSSINYAISTKNKILKSVSFNAEGDFNAAQNRYEGLNDTETRAAAYALMNLSVHSEINYSKKQQLSFQLSVNNIFNTAYQNHLSRLQYFEYYMHSPNGHSGIYNMGRNICAKVMFLFKNNLLTE